METFLTPASETSKLAPMKTNYKFSFVFATAGAIVCLCAYLILRDMTFIYGFLNTSSMEYEKNSCPIISVILKMDGYTYSSFGYSHIVMHPNVFIMSLLGWIFLFIHSLKGIQPFYRFLLNLITLTAFCFGYSYLSVKGLEPMLCGNYAFWALTLQNAFPAMVMLCLTLPGIIALISDFFVKDLSSVKDILWSSIFVLISIILFLYVYFSQF